MAEDITILIPAYNAEKTIGKTIDAIINQTCDKNLIRLVLCNDGSKDGTLDVLKKYQTQYPNMIEVIDQENKGISTTRKILLEHVKTKWCCFCDADDIYSPNAFKQMIKAAKPDTDIVVSKVVWYKKHTFFRGLYANFFNKRFTLEKYIHKCDYSYLWNKLYRYEFIKQVNPYFPDRVGMWEDLFASIQLLQNKPKLAFCTKHTYTYVKGSASGNISLNVKEKECKNFVVMYKWIVENIKNQELIDNYFVSCEMILKYIRQYDYIIQLEAIHKPVIKKMALWRKIICWI